MEVKTEKLINLELEVNEKIYRLNFPDGVNIDDAMQAIGYFHATMIKLKEQNQPDEEAKEEDGVCD